MDKNSISTDQELRMGDYLMSPNGDYKAIFQHDGNFVIYKWSPIWATGTNGRNPLRVLLQQDNNLVMYDSAFNPLWASNTGGSQTSTRMRLTLTNDGQLILDRDGTRVWSSK